MTTFQLLSIVIGLLAVAWPVWYHYRHRKSTSPIQNVVSTQTTISVRCKTPFGWHWDEMHSDIGTHLVNHSDIPAKMKITIKAVLRPHDSDKIEEFFAPKPYDGSVWDFAAKQELKGKFKFEKLKKRKLKRKDSLMLIGTIESSPFRGEEDFQPDPPFKYSWNVEDYRWELITYENARS